MEHMGRRERRRCVWQSFALSFTCPVNAFFPADSRSLPVSARINKDAHILSLHLGHERQHNVMRIQLITMAEAQLFQGRRGARRGGHREAEDT